MNRITFYVIFEKLKLCPGRDAFNRYSEEILSTAVPEYQHPLEFIRSTGRISEKYIHPSLLAWLSKDYWMVPAVQELFGYYANMGIAIPSIPSGSSPGSSTTSPAPTPEKEEDSFEFDSIIEGLKVALGTVSLISFCHDILGIHPEGEIWTFLISKKVLSHSHISSSFREWIKSTPYVGCVQIQKLLAYYDRMGSQVSASLSSLKNLKCLICRDQTLGAVLLPCYHLSVCRACSVGRSVKTCPRCRAEVEGNLQVHFTDTFH